MRNFRSDDRGGRAGSFRGNNSSGGSRGFGRGREERRGGFRDRDSGSSGRRLEMHEVTCDKCGKQCEVPFKPTGDKPVFCSDCFRNENSSGSSFSSSPHSRDNSSSSGSGISQEQYKELNTKLDKILGILEQIEFEEVDEDGESEDDENEAEEAA